MPRNTPLRNTDSTLKCPEIALFVVRRVGFEKIEQISQKATKAMRCRHLDNFLAGLFKVRPTGFTGWTQVQSWRYFSSVANSLQILRPATEVFMTLTSPNLRLGNWRELYTAALFETDRNQISARIAQAEQAIVARARELFSAGNDTIEEDQALDDALYGLRALQSCLQLQAAAA